MTKLFTQSSGFTLSFLFILIIVGFLLAYIYSEDVKGNVKGAPLPKRPEENKVPAFLRYK